MFYYFPYENNEILNGIELSESLEINQNLYSQLIADKRYQKDIIGKGCFLGTSLLGNRESKWRRVKLTLQVTQCTDLSSRWIQSVR